MKSKTITIYQDKVFDFVVYMSYIGYIAILMGAIAYSHSKYLGYMHMVIQLYISLFLIWRFNPFFKVKYNYFDKKIAFNAGVFLLSTSIINNIAMMLVEQNYPIYNGDNPSL